jgi:hypothetical protein
MNTELTPETPPAEGPGSLTELLAGYLLASPRVRHPDADGLTVEDVVAVDYRAAAAGGHVPGPDELARRHPELADAIAVFFRSSDRAREG